MRFTSNCWVSELPRGGAGMAHKIDESFAPITVISPQCYEQNHLFLNFCSVFSQLKRKSSALKCPLYFRYQNGLMHKKSPLSYFFSVPVVAMEALIGETVYLPCNVSTYDAGDEVVLVLWYRADKGTPIYR